MAATIQSELQSLISELFSRSTTGRVNKHDLETRAQVLDLSDDLMEVIALIPAGTYTRERLCNQINSVVTAHGWGFVYGTVR